MADKITYKVINEPTQETVSLDCPGCSSVLHRTVIKGVKSGRAKCNMCSCEFEWEKR